MVKVAELLEAPPDRLWRLVAQAGVAHAVMLLDGAEQQARWLKGPSTLGRELGETPVAPAGERPWDKAAIEGLQRDCAEHGFTIAAIEDTAPMDLVRLGQPGRDEQIGHVVDQIRAMGECGIPVLCYNWMALGSWSRTNVDVELRGGALSTEYDHSVADAAAPLAPAGAITEDQLWDALRYFLEAVVPVAGAAGVMLGLHPDDPPLPLHRGVPRIIRSVEAYRRVLDLVPSPANGITLCQGNFCLMPDAADLPAVIRELGSAGKIAFVHLRDVRGNVERFVESFHDEGKTDLVACMRAYHEVGFDGPLRPDHVATLDGEDNAKPGYGALGRLFAVGYIAGLREAAFGKDLAGPGRSALGHYD